MIAQAEYSYDTPMVEQVREKDRAAWFEPRSHHKMEKLLTESGVWVRFPPLILIVMEKIKLFLKKMLIAFFETISHH